MTKLFGELGRRKPLASGKEDRVVARDAAGDLGQRRVVDGARERIRETGRRPQHDEVVRRLECDHPAAQRSRLYGVDPLYALPPACTAWDGGGCVLERAFEDLGVLIVDYRQAHGRGFSFDHGLGDFVRDFDGGRFPQLVTDR